MSNGELIAELRDWKNTRLSMHKRNEIADALEAAQGRITELEAERRADLTEILAAMRERWGETSREITLDRDALLSAVENVLDLCNKAPGYPGTVRKSDVRKALTDALGGNGE